MLDLNRLHKQWYDWTMKNGPKPEFLKDRIAYFVPGAEVWKYTSSLEALSPEIHKLYLSSHAGSANDVFESGRMGSIEQVQQQPDHYVYDPLDVRPAALEQRDVPNSRTDQTGVLNLFGNGLIYHSDALPADTEITCYVKLVGLDFDGRSGHGFCRGAG
jgi:uncharacterized protein